MEPLNVNRKYVQYTLRSMYGVAMRLLQGKVFVFELCSFAG